MAELIRKDKLIDWSYREPQYYDSMNDRTDMRDFINNLPTTTEAEIRAKAYEKFAEAVIFELECFAREMDGEPNSGFIDMCIDSVNTVADQLKEE